MNDKLRAYLIEWATKKHPADHDDFMVNDYAGGNIDDAYQLGEDAGEIQMARLLLAKFGGS